MIVSGQIQSVGRSMMPGPSLCPNAARCSSLEPPGRPHLERLLSPHFRFLIAGSMCRPEYAPRRMSLTTPPDIFRDSVRLHSASVSAQKGLIYFKNLVEFLVTTWYRGTRHCSTTMLYCAMFWCHGYLKADLWTLSNLDACLAQEKTLKLYERPLEPLCRPLAANRNANEGSTVVFKVWRLLFP